MDRAKQWSQNSNGCLKGIQKANRLNAPDALLVLAQVGILSMVHFWVGVLMGWTMDHMLEKDDERRFSNDNGIDRTVLTWQVTGAVALGTVTLVMANTLLHYMYRVLRCIIPSYALRENNDAHQVMGSVAMMWGFSWSSKRAKRKLELLLA